MDYNDIFIKDSKIKTYISAFFQSLGYAVILAVVFMFVFNYNFVLVNGWSSWPKIMKYSLIVTYKVPFEDIHVDDYVTWVSNGTKVTHRVINVDKARQTVTTMQAEFGNKNTTPDAPKSYQDIEGKVLYQFVLTGQLISYLQGLGLSPSENTQIGPATINIPAFVATFAMFGVVALMKNLLLGDKQPYVPFSDIDMESIGYKQLYTY